MNTTAPDSPWLTPRQAATRANRSLDAIRRALTSGELHGHRRGTRGHWRVHRDALDAWTVADPLHLDRASVHACPCTAPPVRHLRTA